MLLAALVFAHGMMGGSVEDLVEEGFWEMVLAKAKKPTM